MQKIMVDANIIQNHKLEAAVDEAGNRSKNSNLMSKKGKKNELLHPISPYDEIPSIRALFEKLSPTPRIRSSTISTQ
eukprot:CAMPEP_0197193612 /NCGR_PEP_ID=MMETSP1423-20130617/27607_1 /TAXON_ID=476441 /ORGANISM="Pseudo-nitzschia heimii, Strain UNC1101" /LENGTH=76 /DNA_ID=CAMNT_0042646843 /DNA_START=1 /DNA_END=228 /DNA_ORIENTATION=+